MRASASVQKFLLQSSRVSISVLLTDITQTAGQYFHAGNILTNIVSNFLLITSFVKLRI